MKSLHDIKPLVWLLHVLKIFQTPYKKTCQLSISKALTSSHFLKISSELRIVVIGQKSKATFMPQSLLIYTIELVLLANMKDTQTDIPVTLCGTVAVSLCGTAKGVFDNI